MTAPRNAPPIPRAAAAAWARHRGRPGQNAGLIFDRFAPAPDALGNAVAKREALQAVREAAKQASVQLLEAAAARWEHTARAVQAQPFTLATDWRLITGMGRKGPLEIGFTFSHYGWPVLPAGGIKGVARMWGLLAVAESLETDDLRELDELLGRDSAQQFASRFAERFADASEDAGRLAAAFRSIFGTTAQAGGAVFLDGIPAAVPVLELDIMNPHVRDYYQGGQPPTSWQDPNPVLFLAIAAGTPFRFAAGWCGQRNEEALRLRRLAQDWLVHGLTELGAGAKTSAGYGFFSPPAAERATLAAGPSGLTTAAAPPVPAEPDAPLIWRSGTVREYQPERGRGRLVDDATGEELRFSRDAIEARGWSPGRKARVSYAVRTVDDREQVVRLRKA